MALPLGTMIPVPGLTGKWSVWSRAADAPGAMFVVPADEPARAAGLKYACVKVTYPKRSATPTVELLRTEPPTA